MQKSNIVLIGMPGSGKTTIGKKLARHFGKQFIDGDALIEKAANLPIQQVVNLWGLQRFAELEQKVLCELQVRNSIISTGGSAVYSDPAMKHLTSNATAIYLRISANTLLQRVKNESSRGLFKLPAHHMLRLYQERVKLYPKYADIIFDNDTSFTAVAADRLIKQLESQ